MEESCGVHRKFADRLSNQRGPPHHVQYGHGVPRWRRPEFPAVDLKQVLGQLPVATLRLGCGRADAVGDQRQCGSLEVEPRARERRAQGMPRRRQFASRTHWQPAAAAHCRSAPPVRYRPWHPPVERRSSPTGNRIRGDARMPSRPAKALPAPGHVSRKRPPAPSCPWFGQAARSTSTLRRAFRRSHDIPSTKRFGRERRERSIVLLPAELDLSGGCIDSDDADRSAMPAGLAAKDGPCEESQRLRPGGGAAHERLKA